MNLLAGPLLNTFLSLLIGQCIRYYPLRDKWRVSLKTIIMIYAAAFIFFCMIFVVFQDFFAVDYLGNQIFKAASGVVPLFVPFFLIKKSLYENYFLMAVVANYILVIFGAGNYVELTFGGAIAENYPYMICNAVVVLLSIPILPLLLKVLYRMFSLFPSGNAFMWKFIWIIPTLFAALCLMSANIFMGDNAVTTIFIIARIFLGVGMVITCLLFAKTLQHEAKNAELTEHARIMEVQISIQRDQYERMTEQADEEKKLRHDLRHHLAVLKSYSAEKDIESMSGYLEKLTDSIPGSETVYCENYSVNAVVTHYLYNVADKKINLDISLDIPKETGQVSDMDLCVIIGNLLENAVEACNRIDNNKCPEIPKRYIRARAYRENGFLSIYIENSFNGQYKKRGNSFISQKAAGGASPHKNAFKEGVGLSSVKAVCTKYNGLSKIEINDNVWKVSALVMLEVE